jgi:rhodanese-related sulfurtransferase
MGEQMETLLFLWWVLTGVIVISCSLINRDAASSRGRSKQIASPGLDYIRISIESLVEWEMHHSNLLIIDLRSGTSKSAGGNSIPGSLHMRAAQLAHLLRWVPPASRLVFYNDGEVGRFSRFVEQTLLSAGIDGVFILERGVGSWHAHRSLNRTSMRM